MNPRDLPKIPGLVYNANPAGGQRKQTLTYVNGYAVPCDMPNHAGSGGSNYAAGAPAGAPGAVPPQRSDPSPSSAEAPVLPGWLTLDKKVLRFYAFFEEAVTNSPLEKSRVRKMDILFYLVDGTVEVSEPRINNSGLPQGAYLKRLRVPKGPAGPPGSPPPAFVGIEDLSVGADVTLFGRVFHVCGCDAYTRAYYADQGIDQAPDTALPENAIDAQKARASAAAARSNLPTAVQRGMQFLQFDGKVLCFPGILADASAETGARPIILNFYLGDSTGEVKEPGVGLLLHRQRLPVDMPVTGVASVGADPNMQYLRAENLRVGARLRVFAREFTLLDADPFTRAWYKDNLRIDQAPAMPAPAPRPPVPKAPLPPHNGYGSPADSARNCLSLVPKAHNSVRDYGKYMAFSGMVLRFMSSMEAVAPAVLAESDVGRTFTVNWFLEDGTLSIFEPQRPDRPASRYLERSKVCEPGTEKALTTGAMRVGAELIIHGRKFTLLESDGFTQSFMAQHPELWA